MASLEEATSRKSPSGEASITPAAATPRSSDAPVGQPGQQLDHVVVVDQGVGQLDEGFEYVGFAGHGRTSPAQLSEPPPRCVVPDRGRI